MLGFSQVGESQVGMFYPVNLLAAFLDPNFRVVAVVCLHLALANVCTFWLLRSNGLSRGPAFIGAISFGLSGYMFAQVTNYVIVQCSAYLPLMILFLGRYLERKDPLQLGFFSLTVAANLLISHAGTTFMLLGGVSIFFVVAAWQAGNIVKHLAFFGCALALSVVFASIQVFPTLELKPLSERGAPLVLDYVTDLRFTAGLEDRLSFFFPWMLGDSRGGRPVKVGYEEIHQYAGAFVPILAGLTVLRWKQLPARQRSFLTALGIAGVVAFGLSLGAKFPLLNPWALLLRLPVFSMFRIPARWGCIATFALSVTAACGLETLLKDKGRPRTLLLLAGALPAGATFAAMVQEGPAEVLKVFAQPRPILDRAHNLFERLLVQPLSHANPLLLYAILVVPFLLLHAAHRRALLSGRGFQVGLAALLLCDLFLIESPTNPRVNNDEFFASDARAQYFAGSRRYCRLAGAIGPLDLAGFPMNTPAWFGVFSTYGDTPLELRSYMAIERELKRRDLLDYLGACYEFDGKGLVRRGDPLPRAFLVHDVRRGNDPLALFLSLRGKELRSVAYLTPREFEAVGSLIDARRPLKQHASIARFENSLVEVEARTSAPALLVLTDMNYPGWTATLDGRATRILSAQGAFRSVLVPAGSHRVSFEFHPRSVYYGALLTGLALLLFGLVVVRRRHLPPHS